MRPILFLIAAGLIFFAAATVDSAPLAEFTPLGDLPGGDSESEAWGVSSDGSVIVGTGAPPNPIVPNSFPEAFKWTSTGGLVGLGTALSERGTSGSAISGDGSVIAGFIFETYPNRSSFLWTKSSGMVKLSGCACDSFDSVLGMSHDGKVAVGRMFFSNGARAYRWTEAGGAVDLGVLPGAGSSEAEDVSHDGSIVVGSSQSKAFRWTEQTGMVRLTSDTRAGHAHAISADGSFIIGSGYLGSNGPQAVRWQVDSATTTMIGLGDLPGGRFDSYANDVSDDGKVVVGNGWSSRGVEGFRWTEATGMKSVQDILALAGIDLQGWKLEGASGISADGSVIVGYGINPNGDKEAFRAVIPADFVPEPTTLMLATFTILYVLTSRNRRETCPT